MTKYLDENINKENILIRTLALQKQAEAELISEGSLRFRRQKDSMSR